MTCRQTSFRLVAAIAVLAALATAPLRADARGEAKALTEFGVEMAQHGLWREAIYRWEKAVELDPTYARAHNNLGVGYEMEGDLEKARLAYERAMQLAPKDPQIKQNYELFKEINDRISAANDKP